jgi:pseudouridine-5'-phosphate glycosidase
MLSPDRIAITPEVADALRNGRPVVALESTLISHGFAYPRNIEVAAASELAVRSAGAVPRPTLGAAIAWGGWGATTVSATMIAAHAVGIRVFATGGIGGVHRGALGGERPSFDISADLAELARTPVTVVCAGPKAILDVPLTLEYLETQGVPVLAIGTDELPGFYSRGSGIPAPQSVPDIAAAAAVVRAHASLGLGSGILVCTPVPEADALPDDVAREAITRAIHEADEAGITGPAVTPWLLARVAAITDGASVVANTSLILNDARVAGELAVALAG